MHTFLKIWYTKGGESQALNLQFAHDVSGSRTPRRWTRSSRHVAGRASGQQQEDPHKVSCILHVYVCVHECFKI